MKNKLKRTLETLIFILIILGVLLVSSCGKIANETLEKRKDYFLPVCLMVKASSSLQKEDVKKAALIMEQHFGEWSYNIHPECDPIKDNYITIHFLQEPTKTMNCDHSHAAGCVRTFRNKKTSKLLYKDVIIFEPYVLETIRHELAHLGGCEHGDFREPCSM